VEVYGTVGDEGGEREEFGVDIPSQASRSWRHT
jgi:hypothetical protein